VALEREIWENRRDAKAVRQLFATEWLQWLARTPKDVWFGEGNEELRKRVWFTIGEYGWEREVSVECIPSGCRANNNNN
jgi:hypothetical protein